jgi:hypothetical protein
MMLNGHERVGLLSAQAGLKNPGPGPGCGLGSGTAPHACAKEAGPWAGLFRRAEQMGHGA